MPDRLRQLAVALRTTYPDLRVEVQESGHVVIAGLGVLWIEGGRSVAGRSTRPGHAHRVATQPFTPGDSGQLAEAAMTVAGEILGLDDLSGLPPRP